MMLVPKMYQLVSVKYLLKIIKIEKTRHLTDKTDTNRYLADI